MQTPNARDRNTPGPTRDLPEGPNGNPLLRTAVVVAVAVFFASFTPPAVFPAALSQFLTFAALGACLAGLLRREPVLSARHLTHWDEAAAYLVISTVTAWFVDPEAVAEAMRALSNGAGAVN